MNSGAHTWDDEDDGGLPDAAFTEDELAAGVQHIARTGDPNATSSNSRRAPDRLNGRQPYRKAPEYVDKPEQSTRFETFAQAQAWSRLNPGKAFTRAADGIGFEAKPARSSQRAVVATEREEREATAARSSEFKELAPYLFEIYNLGGDPRRSFYRSTWERELGQLSNTQLSRLRVLVVFELEWNRDWLRGLYAQMQRNPRMRRGKYAEIDFENRIELAEGALVDIDERLARQGAT